jgi:hypothetical protein
MNRLREFIFDESSSSSEEEEDDDDFEIAMPVIFNDCWA